MTERVILDQMDADRLASGVRFVRGALWPSRKAHAAAVRRALSVAGLRPRKVTYDAGGNCLTCGEAGRCPGYHATAETPRG